MEEQAPSTKLERMRSEHEKLYSPSEWSKRYGPDEVRNLQRHDYS